MNHRIYFQLDGKDFAVRAWHNVPRVGEHVMFRTDEGKPKTFEIVRVVWNTAPDDNDAMPTINISLAG